MKKIFALLLSLLMVFSLVACGTDTELQAPNDVNGVTTTPATDNAPTTATISEMVLLDQDGIKITAKSLDLEGWMGPEIKVLIENNTDKNLSFQTRSSSVNGYMVETMFHTEVAAGKKVNESIVLSSSDLELCGITNLATIEFSFHIFYTETWNEYLDTDIITINTSLADTHVQNYDASGDVAYDVNGIKIVIKGLADESLFGPSIVFYAYNANDKAVTIQVRSVSINGFMIDPICSADLAPGKHLVDTITFMDSDLEENEIASIESVELSFHIYTADDWLEAIDTDPITITFN